MLSVLRGSFQSQRVFWNVLGTCFGDTFFSGFRRMDCCVWTPFWKHSRRTLACMRSGASCTVYIYIHIYIYICIYTRRLADVIFLTVLRGSFRAHNFRRRPQIAVPYGNYVRFSKNFTILFCWFLRFFFAGCVPILSGFVGFRRDVAGIRIQTQ